MTQTASGDHGDADPWGSLVSGRGEAGGGEDGCDKEGGFVADAASGVLVYEERERRIGCGFEDLAGEVHGLRQGGELIGREATKEDGHEEGGGLGVGDFAVDDGGDERLDLL